MPETDIGDGVGLRDSCAAASLNPGARDATLLVACVRDTGGDAPVVVVFWSDDATASSPTWTEVDLTKLGVAEGREAMDFPSLTVSPAGLLVVAWESQVLDSDGQPTGPQLPTVAVSHLVDPGTWTLLTTPATDPRIVQGQFPCVSTRDPAVVEVAWLSGEAGDTSCQYEWRATHSGTPRRPFA